MSEESNVVLRLKTLPVLNRKDHVPIWLGWASDEAAFAGREHLFDSGHVSGDDDAIAEALTARLSTVLVSTVFHNQILQLPQIKAKLLAWCTPLNAPQQVAAFKAFTTASRHDDESLVTFLVRLWNIAQLAALPETPEILSRVYLPIVLKNCPELGHVWKLPVQTSAREYIENLLELAHPGNEVRLPRNLSKVPVRFFFLRHGETDWNVERRMQGSKDTNLNDRGRDQAIKVGEALREIGLHFDAVYSSDLKRASETAELCVPDGTPIFKERGFRERFMGEVEGMLHQAARAKMTREGKATLLDYGEDHAALVHRLDQGWNRVVAEAEEKGYTSVLIVSHGSALSQLFRHLAFTRGISRDFVKDLWSNRLTNCSVSLVYHGHFWWYGKQFTKSDHIQDADLV